MDVCGSREVHQTSVKGFKRQVSDTHVTTATALKIAARFQITMTTDVHTSKVGCYCNGETWIAISLWKQSGVFNNFFPLVSV